LPLVPFYGYHDTLSLDSRGRFRAPDKLAGMVQRAMGQAQGPTPAGLPATFQRLAFYFVPGPGRRIFLYPATNVRLAIENIQNPPADLDPDEIRELRDYFYELLTFVEADKQNRFQIPDALREHARLDDSVDRVSIVAHNYFFTLEPAQKADEKRVNKRAVFEKRAADLLDPAYGSNAPGGPGPAEPTV
jgi:DNA-binding transcriptional regulator/RsmH inhibitor MraZ